jgi:3-hydroxyacyl-CoA dehydrogenase/enoyl-CoA hydratase/3-hydroxybutyryl-CoA epimerase
MSIQESIRLVAKGDIAILEWDLVGEKVNKLSTQVMERFREIVTELKSSRYKAVILISRKPKIFIAGADIEEIKKLSTKQDYIAVLGQAHALFAQFEDLPMPTIVAIHGACMGGGLELSLCADYRLCSDDDSTRIGLPEVKLGIIPGFGGCWRLPQAIGLQNALDIILNGKAVPGKKAAKMGLVDECVPSNILEQKALEYAQACIEGKKRKRTKRFSAKGVGKILESFAGRWVVGSQAKKMVLSQTKGFYPAPLKALEVVLKIYGMSNRDRALAIETEGFCEVAVTDVSKNLIEVFFLMEAAKKQTGVASGVKPHPVKAIGVLGAGTMGGGIAQVAADRGVEVRLKDINTAAIALGFKSAHEIWQKDLDRKKINKFEFERKAALISGGMDYAGFKGLDVVIEAIVEDMNIKKKVLAETETQVRNDCIIATNTSSLSVTEMAEGLARPENFAGMHFFNPVHKMPLVEVIRGAKSSDAAVATVFDLAKKMGKTPVVVKDGPGFLVNRLLMPWMMEGMFLLQDGMSIETVDRYYTQHFGMPMGPYRLMDEVGLDVCVKVAKIFKKSLGERIDVPKMTENIAQTKRLGRKNGKGFYLYDERGKQLSVDQSIYGELGLSAPTNPLQEKECIDRGIYMMINEASLALIEDRIVETPQDLDLAMIMGTGFPPFRGGLLRYADKVGTKVVVQELEVLAARFGARFKPSVPLLNLARNNRAFYG